MILSTGEEGGPIATASAAATLDDNNNIDNRTTCSERRRKRRHSVIDSSPSCGLSILFILSLLSLVSHSMISVVDAAAGEGEQTCTVVDGEKTCINPDTAVTQEGDEETEFSSNSSLLRSERKKVNRNMFDFDSDDEGEDYIDWVENDPLAMVNDFVTWMEHDGYKYNVNLVVKKIGDYPRNFTFCYDPFFPEDSLVSFIIGTDNVDQSKQYKDNQKLFDLSFSWMESGSDEVFQAMAIYSLIVRMDKIKHKMTPEEFTKMGFEKEKEQNTIKEFFDAYHEALTMAWMYRHHIYNGDDDDDNKQENQEIGTPTSTTAAATPESSEAAAETIQRQDMDDKYYDPLTEFFGDGSEDNTSMDLNNCITGTTGEGNGDLIGTAETFYQDIDYFYERETDNTYMQMNNWLHSSNSHRAHYHDGMIHVPLQYVKDVKRVAYIGGGDNMPLYELLKYPNIELIVGMELDQQVTRYSFKYFGTTPKYHDPRVEWWFGDASKTLKAIPEEYYGSFDFVIVDLLSFVQDSIRVVADLSILDAAAVLMKNDGGVLARQDDYCIRSYPTKTMMKRVIEWDWLDMPGLCEASFTAGSNSIDLLHADRYDHGVPTLVRLKNFNSSDPYEAWMRYYDHTASMRKDQDDYTDDGDINNKWAGYNPLKCKTIRAATSESKKAPLTGFLHVIEAEDVTVSLEDKMPEIEAKILDAVVKQNGLGLKSRSYNPNLDKNHLFLLLEEGYIRIHLFPDEKYVAFDVIVWDSPSKSESIKQSLIRSVGGNPTESTSSFRVVTGGISGLENRQTKDSGILRAAEKVFCGGDDDGGDDEEDSSSSSSSSTDKSANLLIPEQATIVSELFTGLLAEKKKLSSTEGSFAILCGNNAECESIGSSLTSLSNDDGSNFHTVQSCESFDDMELCKSIVEERIEKIVANNNKRFDGVLIGRDVTVDTGKVFHKIFNNTINQEKYLERPFVIASPMVNEEPWRNVLLERIRNELVIAHPLHRADIELYNSTHKDEWFIASVGNENFFESLRKTLWSLKQNANLLSTTKEVESGAKPVQYDHDPKSLEDSHFYESSVEEQWFRQKPMSFQSLIQMQLQRPNAPLKVGDRVLAAAPYNINSNIGWIDNYGMTDYYKATVENVLDNDHYVLKMDSEMMSNGQVVQGQRQASYHRSMIRRFSPDDNRRIVPGDFILMPKVYKPQSEDVYHRSLKWHNDEVMSIAYISAIVLAVLDDGMFSVHYFEPQSEDETRMDIAIDSCILHAEIPELLEVESLTQKKVEDAFKYGLLEVIPPGLGTNFESFVIGEGFVMYAIWPEGNAVMKWDGLERVEVNMFLYSENPKKKDAFKTKFMRRIENLQLAAEDTFPRGYGDVVNFKKDVVGYIPHWTNKNKRNRPKNFYPNGVTQQEISDDEDGDEDDEDYEEDTCNEDDDDYECVYEEVPVN